MFGSKLGYDMRMMDVRDHRHHLLEKFLRAPLILQIPTRWRHSISTSAPFNQWPSCQHRRKNDANLALPPTFHYVSIEPPL
ncbi:hypothetical protein TNCV_3680961 [Trichonephila clavipes]|uniref:Uncharacterized protein n=1 Tax=Trichonephila clavipes TaxID=2585209 RepID=A0A8X6RCD3_TRICX|nr:hypothetical protein TNCV_3680961 [Trichonephila clavipes]